MTQVHPAASLVAGLLSDMSTTDQRWANKWTTLILTTCAVVSFPVAFYMQMFRICFYAIAGGTVLCLALFIPNWRQTPDKQEWANAELCDKYYDALHDARQRVAEFKKGSPPVSPGLKTQVSKKAN